MTYILKPQNTERPMKFRTPATLIAVSLMGLAATACNEPYSEDAKDVRNSKAAIAKDNAALNEYNRNLEYNRAQKADAKARGDWAAQAGESLQIGANKAAIAAKRTERKADERILEEDREDLYQ